MIVFKELVKKEFYHIIRDPRILLLIFILPLVLILLFGFVITTEIKNAKIAIYDKSRDNITRKLKSKIIASKYFEKGARIQNEADLERRLKSGQIKEVVVFENDFAEKLTRYKEAHVQIITDASAPNTANLLSNYTRAIIQDYINEINPNNLSFGIDIKSRMLYNPEMEGEFMFVPGVIALVITLISALMTAIALTREKETGTFEMLLVSPFKSGHIILGKVITYAFLAFLALLFSFLMSIIVFQLPVKGSFIMLMAESLLFILTTLSLGVLFSTLSDNQLKAMMMASVGLMMPTTLLSGFIFSIENMPQPIQWISCIVPARWYITILKDIMYKGIGIQFFWQETLILLFMLFFFILFSIINFKTRLE